MNKNIFYLTALLFVFGCSNQSSEPEVMEAEVETVLLEYMWCDFGPNTSEESLDALVADFNVVTQNSDHPVRVHGLMFQHLKLKIMMPFG